MKKTNFFYAACTVAALLYFGLSGCNKKDGDNCKTCKAYNVENQLKDEETVCSEAEESAFRSRNESRRIECN